MSQQSALSLLSAVCARIRPQIAPIPFRPGVHTATYLESAGFRYTGEGDAAYCVECGLRVSNWALDMNPFTIHSQAQPLCPFILSLQSLAPVSPAMYRDVAKSQGIQIPDSRFSLSDKLIETQVLQNIRRRTFSHWPHRENLSCECMMGAGFFSCTVDDRVICPYCNLFCHQWTPNVDDPREIHRTLSPQCIYVRGFLTHNRHILTITTDGNSLSFLPNNIQARNAHGSLHRGEQDNSSSSSSLDDMIQAGYLDTDKMNNGKCPVCRGSFNLLETREHPMFEHARRYPHCAYARNFFGIGPFQEIEDLYRAIILLSHSNSLGNGRELPKRIAAALDSPMSQRVLGRNIPADVLRECCERQLEVKDEDFESESDLYMGCLIVQKEKRHIGNDPDRIVIPCAKMRDLKQNARNEYFTRLADIGRFPDPPPSNPCVVCLTEQRCLACIPCGHLATCVPCGHSLQACPMCRRAIQTIVRIDV